MRGGWPGVVAFVLLSGSAPAWAALTRAGTDITNVATATYTDAGGAAQSVDSNPSTLRVAEILDLTLTSNDARSIPVTTPDTGDALSFSLTNTGNGSEAFSLVANPALAGDQFDPVLRGLVLDLNRNGLLEQGIDPTYVPGANDPLLEPGQSLTIFVLHDTPGGLQNNDRGMSRLTATAVTGSGAPGTLFAGLGDGGVDAVVGTTGATHAEEGGFLVSLVAGTLSKSQTVADPFGGDAPVPGATITYRLTFQVSGAGNLSGVQIADPIPQHTRYVPGSLSLDGAPLTDIADADAGRFTGAGIEVGLGTQTAPSTHVITFRVNID
ncbi:MAG TPA: hypothetical protein VM074_10225 [Solimonas sp.]|nr:hypothetical protein [Solimonas sp.]